MKSTDEITLNKLKKQVQFWVDYFPCNDYEQGRVDLAEDLMEMLNGPTEAKSCLCQHPIRTFNDNCGMCGKPIDLTEGIV